MDNTQLLVDAAACGNVEDVERLRALTDDDGSALCWAAYYGHSACVGLLRPPILLPQKVLRGYSSCDRILVLQLFLMGTSPLCLAASQGHTACVRLLLDDLHIDVALAAAAVGGHEEYVDVLYPLANVAAALQKIRYDIRRDIGVACLEKRVLLEAVCPSTALVAPRKI